MSHTLPPLAANTLPTWIGPSLVLIVVVVLALIAFEDRLHLRKSMPALLGGGVSWLLAGAVLAMTGQQERAAAVFSSTLLEYGELLLFLVVAMTFVNTLNDRQVFDVLRSKLIGRGLSYRQLYWVTGAMAFVVSPLADNLTTALLMGSLAVAFGANAPAFAVAACINIVVASNAGGAFSPFGDITTLMVWQHGAVPFIGFFALLLPSLVNWLVPAAFISLSVPMGKPEGRLDDAELRPGAIAVLALFAATIAGTVAFNQFLHLPPVFGMMLGLGVLKAYSWRMELKHKDMAINELDDTFAVPEGGRPVGGTLSVRLQLERIEWDTLLFFYGMMLCVSALAAVGTLDAASHVLYGQWGASAANTVAGIASAAIDNIPILFAVLTMDPSMSTGQWLLVTLTAGTGGSLLSIGSAAGVALMGQAKGVYTFGAHLRWIWAIALGYVASIVLHFWLNARLF